MFMNIVAGVSLLFWIVFWVLAIYAVATFLQRLSEISRSLASIDAKLPAQDREKPAPDIHRP